MTFKPISSTVNKMSPRPSLIPDTESSGQSEPTVGLLQSSRTSEAPKPVGRSGSCRICLKAFKPNEFSKTCVECDQKVCEDCASYSKLDECEFMVIHYILLLYQGSSIFCALISQQYI